MSGQGKDYFIGVSNEVKYMHKGNNIGKEIENLKYVYNLIVKEGRQEYKDEYICSFQIINNFSIRELPKKYKNLYMEIVGVDLK